MSRLSPTLRYGQCRFPSCTNRADCDCDDCRLNYCPDHSYDVVHSNGEYKGTVCATCKDRRLSVYTGVQAKHFIPRGMQSSPDCA